MSSPIFLEDKKILLWEKTLPKNVYMQMIIGEGLTELIEYKGFEEIHENIGKYYINASCVKYLINLKRLDESGIIQYLPRKADAPKPEGMKTELLFSGAVAIYSNGIIEGTKISGKELILSEKIWFATQKLSETLKEIIIENNIEKIILGYSTQKEMQKEKRKNNSSNFLSKEDDEPHYRGQGCC